jgi:hypothetical protein
MKKVPMAWSEGVLDAFEHAGWGGILLDADGGVINLNAEAQRHVDSKIVLTAGRITATERSASVGAAASHCHCSLGRRAF